MTHYGAVPHSRTSIHNCRVAGTGTSAPGILGTVVYNSPDQAFSFQKHVRFEDRSNWPDLELDVAGSGVPTSPQLPPYSLTLFRRSSQVLLN